MLIFSLVTTCMYYINPPASADVLINSKKSFSLFLFSSFLWNLLMMYVMTLVKYTDLAKSIFLGNTFDIEGTKAYTKRLTDKIKSIENKFVESNDFHEADTLHTKLKRHYFIEGLARTAGQLVANHFTWINLYVGILLIFEIEVDLDVLGKFLIYDVSINYSYLILFLLFSLPIYVLYKICHKSKRAGKDLSSNCPTLLKIIRITSAIFIFLFFVCLYLCMNHTVIIIVMLVQQTIVGLFLRYAVPDKVENGDKTKVTVVKETS